MRLLFFTLLALLTTVPFAQTEPKHPVVYVMPGPLAGPGSASNQAVVAGSGHKDEESQVAKTYQEFQHTPECDGISENMISDNADYFLLLQHGSGKGNRWAVSDKSGNVIASGDSFKIGTAVKDACLAMTKNWRQTGPAPAK
jgi:hypothetical protein